MCVYESLLIFMGIHECHGRIRVFMGFWMFMDIYGCLWVFMSLYGCLWVFMGFNSFLWMFMGL